MKLMVRTFFGALWWWVTDNARIEWCTNVTVHKCNGYNGNNGNGNNKEDVSELSESEEEIDVLTDESSGESDSEVLKTREKKKPPVITETSDEIFSSKVTSM